LPLFAIVKQNNSTAIGLNGIQNSYTYGIRRVKILLLSLKNITIYINGKLQLQTAGVAIYTTLLLYSSASFCFILPAVLQKHLDFKNYSNTSWVKRYSCRLKLKA
jgi:hypothetical protein